MRVIGIIGEEANASKPASKAFLDAPKLAVTSRKKKNDVLRHVCTYSGCFRETRDSTVSEIPEIRPIKTMKPCRAWSSIKVQDHSVS